MTDNYCEMRQLFYYNMQQLLQNASVHPIFLSLFKSSYVVCFIKISFYLIPHYTTYKNAVYHIGFAVAFAFAAVYVSGQLI